jgi:multidrug efflux pump subunit AcrA (membrane-fusion protein)
VVDETLEVLTVPNEALASFAGVDKVFLVVEGKAREVRVTVGRREADRVEILSGLEPGAQVVLAPGRLQSGQPVDVVH